MARPKKAETAKSVASSLQAALAFCSVAFRETGPVNQTHVVLAGRWAHAFDTVTAAAYPIDDDLVACPHGARLRDALARPGTGLALSLSADGGYLGVKLGGFRARVPCVPLDSIAPFGPDPIVQPAGEALREAFGTVAHMASNSGTTVVDSSLLLEGSTLTATNRIVLIQCWHGLNLSVGRMVIPRVFANALLKCALPIVGIGFSTNTLTVHFENKAWIRTQLYAEDWPSLSGLFADMNGTGAPLPAKFFEAVEAVTPFVAQESDKVYFNSNYVGTHLDIDAASASQTLKDMPISEPVCLPCKQFKHIANRVTSVNWHASNRAVHFYGVNIRALMLKH